MTATKKRTKRPVPKHRTNGKPSPITNVQEVDSLTLRYRMKNSDDVIELDGCKVKMVAVTLERKHSLEVADGHLIATWEFAEDLARSWGCTPEMALLAWNEASQWMADAQKKTRQ